MAEYIHQLADWPRFHWQEEIISPLLADLRFQQGMLIGRMTALGLKAEEERSLRALTADVVKSSEIEGEHFDSEVVRSSIARRLGIEIAGMRPIDRNVEGVVEMTLDATTSFDLPLTEERLCVWHAALFPDGRSGLSRATGTWRGDRTGPMQVVSGTPGREWVHFEAPSASRVPEEIERFLTWFSADQHMDGVLKAGIAHFWFVTIHPFEDGNGRIARAITDMALAISEQRGQRFYSMSSQIQRERLAYYDILEQSQKGTLDITPWLTWFMGCLGSAIRVATNELDIVDLKSDFWGQLRGETINERQRQMLNRLLDGFDGQLTTSKWAKIAKCSQDTALRDITELVELGLLRRDAAGGRSTSYSLIEDQV